MGLNYIKHLPKIQFINLKRGRVPPVAVVPQTWWTAIVNQRVCKL